MRLPRQARSQRCPGVAREELYLCLSGRPGRCSDASPPWRMFCGRPHRCVCKHRSRESSTGPAPAWRGRRRQEVLCGARCDYKRRGAAGHRGAGGCGCAAKSRPMAFEKTLGFEAAADPRFENARASPTTSDVAVARSRPRPRAAAAKPMARLVRFVKNAPTPASLAARRSAHASQPARTRSATSPEDVATNKAAGCWASGAKSTSTSVESIGSRSTRSGAKVAKARSSTAAAPTRSTASESSPTTRKRFTSQATVARARTPPLTECASSKVVAPTMPPPPAGDDADRGFSLPTTTTPWREMATCLGSSPPTARRRSSRPSPSE
mmetsp:Transcript_5017/g.17763  ORF Transcript_5017/g.17763 Transcript_5017/m.17763 type:complete len:324 (+) Transcript_5017:1042-2013(+)